MSLIYHEVGHYSSTVTCMSSYIVALRELSRHVFPIAVEKMLRLGLYYDFMSFVNKAYTMCAHSRSPVPPKRKLILGELVSFSIQPELMKLYAYDFLVMECIIKSVGPKPSTPGLGMHVPQPDTAHEHWDDDAPDRSHTERAPQSRPPKRHVYQRLLQRLQQLLRRIALVSDIVPVHHHLADSVISVLYRSYTLEAHLTRHPGSPQALSSHCPVKMQ
jgi:hypothetical protein